MSPLSPPAAIRASNFSRDERLDVQDIIDRVALRAVTGAGAAIERIAHFVAAVEGVVAVAGAKRVVAAAACERVVAAEADQRLIAAVAVQAIGTGRARERVVAAAAFDVFDGNRAIPGNPARTRTSNAHALRALWWRIFGK